MKMNYVMIYKECHVSLTFEECKSGTFNAKIALSMGHDRDYIKKLYPDAGI